MRDRPQGMQPRHPHTAGGSAVPSHHDAPAPRVRPLISESAILDLAMGPSLAPVLRRVVSAVAAQGGLSVDRISDLLIIVDAVAAGARREMPDGRLRVAVTPSPGRVTVRLGPLPAGGAASLAEACRVPELGSVLDALADRVVAEADGSGDFLTVIVGAEDPAGT